MESETESRRSDRLNLVDCKYLLFLGSGRTGSSVVGQIMNCHPNMLVSNESRALEFCFDNDKKLSEVAPSVCKEALQDLRHGTRQYDDIIVRDGEDENEAKDKHSANVALWQRDWTDVSRLDPPPKGDIRYTGDKKQGSNIRALMKNRDKWPHTLDMKMVPITVMRKPDDVLASYLALGEERNNRTLDETIDGIYNDMGLGYRFIRANNGIAVRYESLLEDCRSWCISLCKVLDLEPHEEWVKVVEKIVTKDKKQLTLDPAAERTFKSSKYYPKLLKMYDDCDF